MPLLLHTNMSILSTVKFTTINRHSIFVLQKQRRSLYFYQLTNQNSPESSIDTKFQRSCKLTSAYYLFQITAFQRLFLSLWKNVNYRWKKIFLQCCFQPPRNIRYAKLCGAFQRNGIKHSVFLSKVMQKRYKLDLAIIRFSAYDNPLPLHTNKSIFSTIRSTTTSKPSSFFSKNSEEVINFQHLTNQTSPEVSIVTKFQESRKFTSAYYMLQITACQRMFVFRWVYVK